MANKLTRQGARNLTQEMDRIASVIQQHADVLGIPEKVALDFAKRSDLLSDAIEMTAVTNYPLIAASAEEVDESAEDEAPAASDKEASAEWSAPAKDETGTSVTPAQGWDPNAIADDHGGPFKQEGDEPYMSGAFAQNWFHQLRDKQQAGQVPGVGHFAAHMTLTACLADMTTATLSGDASRIASSYASLQDAFASLPKEAAKEACDEGESESDKEACGDEVEAEMDKSASVDDTFGFNLFS